MVAVAFVLFRLIDDNEEGKADARLVRRADAVDQPLPGPQAAGQAARPVGVVDVELAEALRDDDDARRSSCAPSACWTSEGASRVVIAARATRS